MKDKKIEKFVEVFLCFILACIALFSYFKGDISVLPSQDLTYHINRFIGLSKAFENGQILPKIYPYSNNSFGYGAPLFYCDLFLYPFAILYHFGLSAVLCFKFCVLFYTFLVNLFVYFILKKETNNKFISFVGMILYLTCNYHLQNVLIRSALGEVLALTYIPLVLHSIYKILIKHEDSFIYLGVSFSLLVMCHLISSLLYGLFFFVMIVIFIILNRKDKELIYRVIKTIMKGTIIALLLCAWYLVPMFEQLHSQTFWLSINAKYNNISSGIQSILDIFNVFAYSDTYTVGLPLIVLGFSSFFIKNNKYIKIIVLYCIFVYLILLGVIPGQYLNIIQFYFRLNVVLFPLLTICSIYTLLNFDKKIYICSIVLIFSLVNVIKTNIDLIHDDKYSLDNNADEYEVNHVTNFLYDLDYNHDELGGAEYLPYTEYLNYLDDSWAIKCRDENGEVVDYIYEYDRNFLTITFDCNNDKDIELLLPLSWYKGYNAYEFVDGKWEKIDCSYDLVFKEVLIIGRSGSHTYMVTYKGTALQNISLIISFSSLIILVICSTLKKKKIVNV